MSAPVVAHLMTLMVGLHVFGFDFPFEYAMVFFSAAFFATTPLSAGKFSTGGYWQLPFLAARSCLILFPSLRVFGLRWCMLLAFADLSPSSWAAMLGISAPVGRLVPDVRCSSALV